jgi:hypothetical protein
MTNTSSGPPDGQKDQQNKDLAEFERKQREELQAFENKEHQELENFERKQADELRAFEKHEHPEPPAFDIKIDRTEYKVHKESLTGVELRHLPNPPIGPDRDLFEVVPGGSDKKIGDHEAVKMHNGLRFFTAPAQINPG